MLSAARLRSTFASIGRLARDRSGIAFTEFALVLPVLVLLGFAGLELSNMAMAYLRVNNIAIKTADNAARVRTSIDEADLNEIFLGAKLMGQSINFGANGRIILSNIQPVLDSASPPAVVNQKIGWQRCYGANAANSSHGNVGDLSPTGFGLSSKPQKITAAKNTSVMLAEVVYDYQPLFAFRWFGPITMRVAQGITVRERSDETIKNASSLSASQEALCSNPHAG